MSVDDQQDEGRLEPEETFARVDGVPVRVEHPCPGTVADLENSPTLAECTAKYVPPGGFPPLFDGPLAVKDSGTRRAFSTGSQRDAAEGKGRYDLVPPVALRIVAQLYEKGAQKYDARNWEKGQPCSVYLDCAMRHAQKHLAGWRDEDHLAASVWNLLGAIHTEHQIARGKLPRALLDWPDAYVTEADAGGPVYEGEPCYKPETTE